MKTKIDIEGINFKEFTLATEEDQKEFARQLHPNNEKWQQDFMKKNYFLKTKDGYIMAISTEKALTIYKDLYYDDEKEAPEKTLKYFIDYNIRMNNQDRYEYLEKSYKCYIQQNYSFELKNACVNCMRYEGDKDERYFIRELTDEEKQEYIKILKLIKTKFIERLAKYFEKYNNKIYSIGYWVNR